ncbi:Predicted oxidoreductase [Pedobacter westerhofensis]|uniref:Predicted oxidoreductase n=1 Tax=Pedobacter westerhofensis TaxID=425512 RepID=A0A521BIP7_9SPHI|nr:aldo/keto reductase [Pedobacter westerhofensis]SMO47027.1 Predicted oxidoreductase [Pedobacter westerhofensis]
MQYSIIGKSDLKVSRVSFGCMSLTGSSKENEQIVHRALELGVNFFDTADLYEKGDNEKKIGSLLRSQRNKVVIASKAGNQWRADGSGWDWNPSKKHILAAADESLKRLQTDYIDLYQLHGGTKDDPIDETIEAFEILKQQGKIRFYGISSIRPNVIREYVQKSGIVSVMMQYSLLDRRAEEECFDLLEQHGISVLSRGGVAQGLLVNKPAKPYLGWSAEEVAHAAGAINQVKGTGSAAQTAIRFVLQHPAVASAVIGVRTLAQLEDIALSLDLPLLTTEEMSLLAAAAASQNYSEHR